MKKTMKLSFTILLIVFAYINSFAQEGELQEEATETTGFDKTLDKGVVAVTDFFAPKTVDPTKRVTQSADFYAGLNRSFRPFNDATYSGNSKLGFLMGARYNLHFKRSSIGLGLSYKKIRYDYYTSGTLKYGLFGGEFKHTFNIGSKLELGYGILFFPAIKTKIDDIKLDNGFSIAYQIPLRASYNITSELSGFLNLNSGVLFDFDPNYEFGVETRNLITISIGVNYKIPTKTKSIVAENDEVIDDFVPESNVQKDYSDYSDSRLKELLKSATANERYDEATYVQQEIDKRAKQNTLLNVSTADLKKQLKQAIDKEDYAGAEALQNEIDKRDSPYRKLTVNELQKLEEEAILKEDYKKAEEIRAEIDRRK